MTYRIRVNANNDVIAIFVSFLQKVDMADVCVVMLMINNHAINLTTNHRL